MTRCMLCTAIAMISAVSLSEPLPRVDDSANRPGHHDLTELIGVATVDTTVQGLHLRLWLITQVEHKKIMKEKNMPKMMEMEVFDPDKNIDPTKVNMSMGEETTRLMMAGTHFIIASITDSSTGSEMVEPMAALSIVPPSRKMVTVDLIRTMSYFGLGLAMKEKGIHHLTLDVNANGVSRAVHFRYTVH